MSTLADIAAPDKRDGYLVRNLYSCFKIWKNSSSLMTGTLSCLALTSFRVLFLPPRISPWTTQSTFAMPSADGATAPPSRLTFGYSFASLGHPSIFPVKAKT